jgi:diacylglycerol kinase family enzyme
MHHRSRVVVRTIGLGCRVVTTSAREARRIRIAAGVAIALVVAVVALTVADLLNNLLRLGVQLALLALAILAAWFWLTRAGARRVVALIVVVAALVGFAASVVIQNPESRALSIGRVAVLVLATGLGRWALHRAREAASAPVAAVAPVPVERPTARPALIINLRSGGGKAERARLAEACRARGIEPIVLEPGDDLQHLAGDAIDRGAPAIGMAGGDGSQALVATVAAERQVPMVVVPAGTRNHLARDLGIDRNDVVGALDAFDGGLERRIDLAWVGDRVFVNNVSLGVYAAIVRSPEYRDAKVDTVLGGLPKLLGPGSTPFDLRFTGPDGQHHERAHLIQISNNPYASGPAMGRRPRLDAGCLEVISLVLENDRAAASFLTALAAGRPDRFPGYAQWRTEEFEVESGSEVDAGIDGESLVLAPPLRFSIRPQALRLLLPPTASPTTVVSEGLGTALKDLARLAGGRPVEDQR